ncbi:MerR family transcriptional regulator [Fusibacter ferrireducens]|uniref:MerR family transcriptional regulator n=1 Tax=Fusibacter ferrireducens TaxID=2785058 RepID=A0ABR9ZZG9_9FIRM|nr:MerR family transcriptional regulator [Fusibacter ferrireducens]MBF4695766.1 MerR family transcriptional regulator [Fusibacter ferrireducens]
MFQIGLFSKMNRVTTKTLRHYDEIGLLKPAFVDQQTGYRYYGSTELVRLNKIIALKQLGLSLQEIQELIDQQKGIEIFLTLKEKEIELRIKEETSKLSRLQNYSRYLKGEQNMNYSPVIKALPEVIVASMRLIAPNYESYFDFIPKMGDEMRAKGAVCAVPEYCFNIYHDGEYRESDIDLEVCEAVVDYCEDSEKVKYKKIDAVENALCVMHKGPYTTLPDAYAFAFSWIEANAYVIDGLPRESYIDGIWNKEDENEWLTELQIPVKKI